MQSIHTTTELFAPPVLLGAGSLPRPLALHRVTPFSPLVCVARHSHHSLSEAVQSQSNRCPTKPIDDLQVLLVVLIRGGRRRRRRRRRTRGAWRETPSGAREPPRGRDGRPLTPNTGMTHPLFSTRQCFKPRTTDARPYHNNNRARVYYTTDGCY